MFLQEQSVNDEYQKDLASLEEKKKHVPRMVPRNIHFWIELPWDAH